jgi:hypothetical protein
MKKGAGAPCIGELEMLTRTFFQPSSNPVRE